MKFLPRFAGTSLTRAGTTRCQRFLSPSVYPQQFSSKQNRMASTVRPADRLDGQPKNVWIEFIALANETKSINLGQGFPNFQPPKNVIDDLIEATSNSGPLMNQYTRAAGHPRLVNVVAELYGQYFSRKIDPMTEVLVTIGAYNALYLALMGHINPGDEVIIIEPSFDCYRPVVMMAGGISKHVALKPSSHDVESTADWLLDEKELEAAFSPKTKAIVVNTPNNPLGKVLTYEELEMIANLCKKHNILCISDEVYEHLVYDDNKHIRMASSFPDMWDRTITTYSAGKIFCATGWRLGWAIAPAPLIKNMVTVHQNCAFTCPTPLQEAVARALEVQLAHKDTPECYFKVLTATLTEKRARMEKWLRAANLSPTVPQGGYFMLARIDDKAVARALEVQLAHKDTPECYFKVLTATLTEKRARMEKWLRAANLSPTVPQGGYFMLARIDDKDVDLSEFGDGPRDYKFVRYLMKTQGVATIPCSAFFGPENKHIGEKYIRLCFIKEDETIDAAGWKLVEWSKTLDN